MILLCHYDIKNYFRTFPKILEFDTPFGKVICDVHELKNGIRCWEFLTLCYGHEIPAALLNHIFSISAKDTGSGNVADNTLITSNFTQERGIRTTSVKFDLRNSDLLITINETGTDVPLR